MFHEYLVDEGEEGLSIESGNGDIENERKSQQTREMA